MARASELIATTRPFSEPHILVSATGDVLAANPAASRAFGIEARPDALTLSSLVTDPPERVLSFLRSSSRSTSLVPGAFTLRLPDGSEKRFGCAGGLVQPRGAREPAIVLVRFRPHEKMIPGFLHLNDRIGELTRALHERRLTQEALEARSEELVTLAHDLERQKAQAQAASRAKTRFLSAMSHELRTPLNGIVGYVDLLELGLDGPLTEAHRARLARIRRSTEHLVGMIEEILEFSQLETSEGPVHVGRVDLVEVLRDAAEMIEPAFVEARLQLTRPTNAEPVILRTDPVKVRQILLNLLSNAVKFTSRGGVRMAIEERPGHVGVSVADTGIGIDPEHLAQIFEPFWQAQRELGGSGLGLTVTRQLARRLGGEIEVQSVPGVGSSFTLVLPHARAKKHILLVEDDPDTQNIYRSVLVHAGFGVTIADNGEDAVRFATDDQPDLILMDIDLPVLDGWEAGERLKADLATREIPIVAISAGKAPEHFARASALGFEAYFAKPFPPREVLNEVQRLFEVTETP